LLLLLIAALVQLGTLGAPARVASAAGPQLAHPILFVTSIPTPAEVLTSVSIFGNQLGDVSSAGRGGDLWMRYKDGTLKNLTAAAGYGVGQENHGANSIAVRDPYVSWDGTKALFSMVVGAPTSPTSTPPAYFWQIYEITNLGQVVQNQSVVPIIQKVAHQPANYNNITPIYGTNGRIIFTSDIPRGGPVPQNAYLYPLLDEYNMRPTNTGLWSLDPSSGDLFHMDHSPSGDLTPIIDSYGRVIFVRWDHLERDQQADVDALNAQKNPPQPCTFCTFNYSDESATATNTQTNTEVFPEPRPQRIDLLPGLHSGGHHRNEFLPWQINEDGTNAETINHIGRHELLGHIPAAFTNDSNLQTMNGPQPGAANQYRINGFLQIKEDPANHGTYYGVDALERTHASGQIIKLTGGAPTNNADQMAITYITHRETISTTFSLTLPNSDGHYRDPLPMTDGKLVAAYTTYKHFDFSTTVSSFDFRLHTMIFSPTLGFQVHDQPLTAGISKSVSFYDRTTNVQYNGNLWELQPVEVYARTIPATRSADPLTAPELNAFNDPNVHITESQLRAFLTQNNLALIVSRDVTKRDDNDLQQPYRLQVGAAGQQTAPGSGTLYRIDYLQIFQADQLRGMSGSTNFQAPAGRRVLAEPLHDSTAIQYNPAVAGPAGSVVLGQDGSMAAFVPARRAVTWQLTDANGAPVVRERIWMTAQPGEIRVCAACHGINDKDQAGATGVPTNTPQALIDLLKSVQPLIAATPTLTSLSPASAAAGGGSFTLTVNGTNFAGDARVQWNGSPRSTIFVSSTQLTATIPAADIAASGTANVTVANPSAATVSNALPFTISGPGQNPVPSISGLSPASATAGGASFTLTINGTNFVSGATVHWGATALTPSSVGANQIAVQIPANLITSAGNVAVTVVNPGPGGGTSNAATFTISGGASAHVLYLPLTIR
jgi:hypothetical protein